MAILTARELLFLLIESENKDENKFHNNLNALLKTQLKSDELREAAITIRCGLVTEICKEEKWYK